MISPACERVPIRTVPVRNFRSSHPQVPWRGSTDSNPFQVMLAVQRAACSLRHPIQTPAASRNRLDFSLALEMGNGPSSLTRPVLSFEKPRRRIKWGPGMHLGIPGGRSQQPAVKDAAGSQGRGSAVDWFSTSPPAAPGGCPNDAIRHQTKEPEAVKQRTRDVDAGLLAGCGLMFACVSVRPYCQGSLISLMDGWWGTAVAVCVRSVR